MTRTDLIDYLRRLEACDEAQEWVEGTPGTPDELWADCKRGDWLLWLAASAGVDRRVVVLTACDCAETTTPCLAGAPKRPALAALETARRWARGEATAAEVRAAAEASARAAADAADAADAAEASARAAARAARAAYAAEAAYAADAADAADAASYAAADLVRARIPWADVEAALLRGTP